MFYLTLAWNSLKLAVSGDNRSGQRLFIVSDVNLMIKKVFVTVASVPAVATTGVFETLAELQEEASVPA